MICCRCNMNVSKLLNFVYLTTFASILVYALPYMLWYYLGSTSVSVDRVSLVFFIIFVVASIIITVNISFQVFRRAGNPNKLMYCKRCDATHHCYCQQPPHKVGRVVSFILTPLLSSHLIMVFYSTEC